MQIFEQGWMAGLRGKDPRECPYPPMTVEAREWLSFHRLGVFYATADDEVSATEPVVT